MSSVDVDAGLSGNTHELCEVSVRKSSAILAVAL